MPLVNQFGILHSAIQLGNKILRKPNKGLNCQEDISGKAENGMGRFEMGPIMVEFVYLDNDQACNEEVESKVV